MDLKNNFTSKEQIFVDKKAFDFLWRVNLNKESIILPNIGNCGEIYLINKEKLRYKNNVLGPNAILVRSITNNNKFLSYSFQTKRFQDSLKLIISPNGQTKFNKTDLKTIEIIIPKTMEQVKIGNLLNNIDNLITLHQRKFNDILVYKLRKKILFLKFTKNVWEQRKFEDELQTVTDYVAAGSFADLAENVKYLNFPNYAQLVRTMDLKNNFTSKEQIFVDKKAFDFLWRVNLNKESIILPNIGNCGEIYLINKEKLRYKNNVLGPNAILVRSITNNNKFLSYSFQTKRFQDSLKLIISPNGQTKFNKTDLKTIEIIIPKTMEQVKIGNLLNNIDNLITLHHRKYTYIFYSWEQRKLEDFGKATGGTSIESEFSENGIYKVISIGSYSENSKYNDQGIRAILSDKTKEKILNKSDLTMILNDKTANGRIIGRVLYIDKSGTYVYNQRTERIEIYKEYFEPIFIYQLLNAPQIRNKIIKQSQGNTQIFVNWNGIKNTDYLVPSKTEQVKLGELFTNLDNLITLHQHKELKRRNDNNEHLRW